MWKKKKTTTTKIQRGMWGKGLVPQFGQKVGAED